MTSHSSSISVISPFSVQTIMLLVNHHDECLMLLVKSSWCMLKSIIQSIHLQEKFKFADQPLARERKRHGHGTYLSLEYGCHWPDFTSIWIWPIAYFKVSIMYAIALQHVRVLTGTLFVLFCYIQDRGNSFSLVKTRWRNLAGNCAKITLSI